MAASDVLKSGKGEVLYMTRMEIEKIKPVMAHRSWRDLRRGSFDQLGVAVHHGTSKVGASSRAFAMFKPPAVGSSEHSQNLWLRLGQLPGIEECLRMFTAVEILEGENKVACRRCWKIELL